MPRRSQRNQEPSRAASQLQCWITVLSCQVQLDVEVRVIGLMEYVIELRKEALVLRQRFAAAVAAASSSPIPEMRISPMPVSVCTSQCSCPALLMYSRPRTAAPKRLRVPWRSSVPAGRIPPGTQLCYCSPGSNRIRAAVAAAVWRDAASGTTGRKGAGDTGLKPGIPCADELARKPRCRRPQP